MMINVDGKIMITVTIFKCKPCPAEFNIMICFMTSSDWLKLAFTGCDKS